jgi:hypothetical protein
MSDNRLWIEIDGNDNSISWAVSEIDLTIDEENSKIAFNEQEFGKIIPNTDRKWNAYSGI